MTAEVLELEVGAPAHGGHCVARVDGRVVFVRHALPGETVRATVTEGGADAKFWRADATEILESSPDRVPSAWPAAGPGGVGGGELAHVSLAGQRQWKRAVLQESFERFAGREFAAEVESVPGDEEAGGLGYRTRVDVVADAEGRPAMHQFRSHTLVPVDGVPIATDAISDLLRTSRFSAGVRVHVVDAGAHGEVRCFVEGQPLRGSKVDRRPNAPRMVHESVTVGPDTWDFRVDGAGFWQLHRHAPSVLVAAVLDAVGEADAVADLYSGAGLFTVPLASQGRSVTAVEADAAGARAARRNAHAFPTAQIVHGDVRRTLAAGIDPVTAVVLDPPRSGAGAKTLDVIAQTDAETLVYVACDPVALARDTALLDERGYDFTSARSFDLFPMTHHVETVATFTRR